MSQSVIIRPFAPGDEEEIVRLLQSVFNGWPHFDLGCPPLDHWHWKYDDNPLRSKSVAVAESEERIIGCSHGFHINVKIGHRSLKAQQSVDLAISEDFRGMGIYPKITAAKNEITKEKKVSLSYGLSTTPVVVRSKIKIDQPQFPSQIRHMTRIMDVEKHLLSSNPRNKLIKKIGYTSLRTLNRVENIADVSARSGSESSLEIFEATTIDEKMEDLWNDVKDDYDFIVERDKDYMNWRYLDDRGGKYALRYASDGDKILGYTVLRVNRFKESYPEGYIVDLLTPIDRIDVAEELIKDAIRFFTERGVNVINSLAVKGHPFERLLRRREFVYDRTRLILFVRSVGSNDDLSVLYDSPPNKLHFAYGDIDWI
jgi:hypothetical protein